MSDNPTKYEVLIEQYFRSILDISATRTCLFQQHVPTQAWACVVVRWVKTILFHAVSLEVFKHVCQQDHICLEIEVVVIAKGVTSKPCPHVLRVFVLFVCDVYA